MASQSTGVGLGTLLREVLGARTATRLGEKLDLYTVEELLRYYPRRYDKRGQLADLAKLNVGDKVTVLATVKSVDSFKPRVGSKVQWITRVVIGDSNRLLTCTFFNQRWLAQRLTVGTAAMFSGTVSQFNRELQITSPQVAKVGEAAGGDGLADAFRPSATDDLDLIESFPGGMIPIYPLVDGITMPLVQASVRQVLTVLDQVDDPMPEELLTRRELTDLLTALREVHRPQSRASLEVARRRLRYDEALSVQLVLARRRADLDATPAQPCPPIAGGVLEAFEANLPFELTPGQREVGEQIGAELAGTRPMNRLLQGEVGSGKTVVALRAMLQVIDSGRQAVLLAPTEVLATQHARTLRAMLGDLGVGGELGADDRAVRITLLTGSLSAPARREALAHIGSGEPGLIVGTHALLSDPVRFPQLGLVVVDEQHRFGVQQRDTLRQRNPEQSPPHLLVMTATPIPRTVAMTVYGDLDTSTLTGLPAGRSPIASSVVPVRAKPAWLDRVWARLREEVAAGHQAFVVCPRIGDEVSADAQEEPTEEELDDEDSDQEQPRQPLAVLEVAAELAAGPLSGLRLAVLHGRLPAAEKDAIMRAFAAGALDVLVATTVIEVGVDVPNATAMVIMDAERFGMSQLHQLRGRVGRGSAPAVCLLVSQAHPQSLGMERLSALETISDGFELAEVDLRLRREGDVLGTAQAGRASGLKQLSLLDHRDVIEQARTDAAALIAEGLELSRWAGLLAMVTSVIAEEAQEFLDKL